MKRFTQSLRWLDAVWLAALCAYVLAGIGLVPFHGDESTLMYMSRDYHYQFIQRDLDLVRYRDDSPSPQEQYLRLINGSIGKYLFGLASHVAGYTIEDVNEQWDWGGHWDYNVSTGHMPPEGMLIAARWSSALLLCGGIVALFALGRMLGGRQVAYLATLYFALNPAVLVNGRRAMMESAMLLGEIAVVAAGAWYARRPSWWAAVLLGAAAGLAMSAKHTNLFTIGAVLLACAAYPLVAGIARRGAARVRPLAAAGRMVLAALVMALVFYVLNPVWWGANALYQTTLILRLRSDLLAGQTQTFGGYANALEQAAGFFRHVFVVLPQYYEAPDFAVPLAESIARYESSMLAGVSLGGSLIGGLVMLALTLLGAWAFARNQAIDLAARSVVLAWAAVIVAAMWLLTPVDWQRYYGPVYPMVALFAAFGAVWAVQRLRSH